MIPARYGATRFPAKLVQLLGGKPVIQRTYENTRDTGLFDEVVVVTDHDEIADTIAQVGGKVIRSIGQHESGTDRIAEAAAGLDVDVILNVQGDEPFINQSALAALLKTFTIYPETQVASLMQTIDEEAKIQNPNIVKVVTDLSDNSLLFSRSPLPYPRDAASAVYHEHIGVYAFRKAALMQFTQWEMTPLEKAEKIECLRFLEHGIPLRMVSATVSGYKIDTPEDLVRAEAYLAGG